jgi:hypothetical protein
MRLYLVLLLFLLFLFYFTCLKYFRINSFSVNGKKPCYNDKKIAICISGQFRNIYDMLINHKCLLYLNPDIFICADDNLNEEEKRLITNFYNPKKIIWDQEKITKIKNYPENMIYMLKRIYLCDKLRQEYEKNFNFEYDIVIRLRPDLVLQEYIPENIINNFRKDALYIPIQYKYDIWWSRIFGPTDMFVMGDSNIMKIYSECYLNLNNMESDTCTGENILFGYYSNHIKNVYKFKCRFVLYSMIFNWDFESLKNLFIKQFWSKLWFLQPNHLIKCNYSNNFNVKKNIQYID